MRPDHRSLGTRRHRARAIRRQRGSTLIVALGVLTLLSVLAVTFYQVMNLEMKASQNYVDGVKSVLAAKAGLARTIEELRVRAGTSFVTDPKDPSAPWNYENGAYHVLLEESVRPSLVGSLGMSYDDGLDRFKVKVIDTQAQININNNEESMPDILDHLGIAILTLNPRAAAQGINPIAAAQYGPWRGGRAIIEFRTSLPGQLFSKKSQLKEIIPSDEAYKLLDSYITTISWTDPLAVRAIIRDPLRTPTEVEQPAPTSSSPDQYVRRAPVNVNIAPIEVLAAVIAKTAGRAIYYEPGQITTQIVEEQSQDWKNPDADRKEELSYGIQEHLIYIEPIGWTTTGTGGGGQPDISVAIQIAQAIDAYRRGPQGPFDSHQELELFIDQLPQNLLPAASDSRAPAQVKSRSDFATWYRQAARSVLKANFNPNGRINYFNPNKAAYLLVDKGSLIYQPDLNNQASAYRAQTMELCFGSKGVFEITSLGEIMDRPGTTVTNATTRDVFAQAKVRTVVKLFDQITHTSQLDFERNDQEFQTDRQYVETYPENRALWDYLNPDDSGGDAHEFDGRIELAPFNGRADAAGDRSQTEWAQFGRKLFEHRFEERKNPTGTYSIRDNLLADVANMIPFGAGGITNFMRPFGTATDVNKIGYVAKTFPWGLQYPDGFYTGELDNRKALLWYRASFADPNTPPQPELQGESALTTGSVLPTKGGVELWYKPDFDWAVRDDADQLTSTTGGGSGEPTERFCGLIHVSHVYTNQVTNTKTRGTQFYLMRNTRGDLRVTRIYYEVVGEDGNDLPKIADPDPNDNIPASGVLEDIEDYKRAVEEEPVPIPPATPVYVWPPAELANPPAPISLIKHARTDAFVPFDNLKFWRAREWHHIAVYWDDQYAGTESQQLIKLFVDGRMINTNHTMPRDAWTVEEDRLFSRLNEPAPISRFITEKDKRPKDHLYIGGLARLQSVQGGGIFKHTREVELPANGTIDDVRFYDGTQVPNGDLTPPERFLPGVGTYQNRFDLTDRFPPGFRNLSLANMSFTAYLPTSYAERLRPQGAGTVTVTLFVNGNPVGNGGNPYVYDTVGQKSDFSIADPAGGQVTIWDTDRITYQIDLEAADFGGGFALDTPVVEDITLTFFLPRTEILLQERLFD